MFNARKDAGSMAAVEASIRAAVSDSEGRTAKAIDELRAALRTGQEELRTDLRSWQREFMTRERVEDRWKHDDARFSDHEQQLMAHDARLDKHDLLLGNIATKDDIGATVKDSVSAFVTEAQVRDIVTTHRGLAMSRLQQMIMWIVVILGFLSSQGFIHPLALFTGGR